MELVETTLTPLQRRTGAVWVPWSDLVAQQQRRGDQVKALAPGDDVLLQFDGDRVQRGWVLRNAYAGNEGAYVIVFGRALDRRVPMAAERRRALRAQATRTDEAPSEGRRARVVPIQRERRRINLYL